MLRSEDHPEQGRISFEPPSSTMKSRSQQCCRCLMRFFSRRRDAGARSQSDIISLPPFPQDQFDDDLLSPQFGIHGFPPDEDSFRSAISVIDGAIGSVIRVRSFRDEIPWNRLQSTNTNHISHYAWLMDLMQSITRDQAGNTAQLADGGQLATPLFVVAGACPNKVFGVQLGMQAMMYAHSQESVLFWWVKPQKHNAAALEQNTLSLNTQGEFKNAVSRAKEAYEPLASKFNGQADGDFTFNIDSLSGRAYIDERDETGITERLFLYFVWQETWSTIMARKKFMRGKLFYQKASRDGYYARQYEMTNGKLILTEAAFEEKVPSLLPPDHFQDLFEIPT